MMDLSALTLAIAMGMNNYQGEEAPAPYFKMEVGHEEKPVYLFGQYEQNKWRMLGQSIGDGYIASAGVGFQHRLSPQLKLFGEVGYGYVDQGPRIKIQQEIIYTELLGRHRVDYRPAPVYPTGNYDQNSYETKWEVSDGILGAVGLKYEASNGFNMSVAYRPFMVEEHIEMWDVERRAAGRGYWQETRSKNLSAFQLSIGWTF